MSKLLERHPDGHFVVYVVTNDGMWLDSKKYGVDKQFKALEFSVDGPFIVRLTLDTFEPCRNITSCLNQDYMPYLGD